MEGASAEPMVTVGVPLYNHADYISQCVSSVLDQSYQNLQVIVIDDGSTDSSYSVLENLAKKRRDRRLIISSRDNRGMCATLNEIAHLAKGKYISMLGSDDYWGKDKIRDQVAFLEARPELALVHSNSVKVDGEGKEIKKIDYSEKENSGQLFEAIICKRGGINTPSHLYRTSVYDAIGFYDTQFGFEDTDFWLRLTNVYDVGYIDAYHTYYRWHTNNMSRRENQLKVYNRDLEAVYRKNVKDKALLKYALLRLYKKSLLRSLKSLNLPQFFFYIKRYFSVVGI